MEKLMAPSTMPLAANTVVGGARGGLRNPKTPTTIATIETMPYR